MLACEVRDTVILSRDREVRKEDIIVHVLHLNVFLGTTLFCLNAQFIITGHKDSTNCLKVAPWDQAHAHSHTINIVIISPLV